MPGENFVKVKIAYSALSDTDALIFSGEVVPPKYPITIGRQAVGMVTEVGEGVTHVARGDRVVIDPYVYCDLCSSCKDDRFTDCIDIKTYGTDEDGFLSDFALVRSEDIYELPDRISDEDAIFAGHIAYAMHIAGKLSLERGKYVAIMGATQVGLVLAQIALYYQAIPIVVDSRADRLALAESLGIYYCVNTTTDDARKKIFSFTGGSLAGSLVYFARTSLSLEQSLSCAGCGAKIVMACANGVKTEVTGNVIDIFTKQLSVCGITNGAKLIPIAINMLANKSVSVSKFISKVISFNEVGEALKEKMEYPNKHMKVLVKM